MSAPDHFNCPYCRQFFAYVGALTNHVRRKHRPYYRDWVSRRKRARLDREPEDTPNPREDFMRPVEEDLELELADSDAENEDSDDSSSEDSSAFDIDEGELQHTSTQYSEREHGKTYELHEIPEASRPQAAPVDHEKDPWGPFQTEAEFKLARWFVKNNISKGAIEEYFQLCARFPGVLHGGRFSSAHTLLKAVNLMPFGLDPAEWKTGTVRMRLEEDVINPSKDRLNTDADGYVKWHMRDPLKVIQHLLSQTRLDGDFVYEAVKEFDKDGQRLYSEVHTGDWMYKTQVWYAFLEI